MAVFLIYFSEAGLILSDKIVELKFLEREVAV